MTDHEIKADFVVNSDSVIEKQQAAIDKHEVEIVHAMRDAIQAVPVCSDQAYYEARKIFRAVCALNIAALEIQTREQLAAYTREYAGEPTVGVSSELAAVAEQMTADNAAQIESTVAETQLYGSSVRKLTNDDGKLIVSELSAEEKAAFDRSIQEADIAENLASASPLDVEGSRKGKVSKLDGQGVTGEVSALDAEQPDPAAAARAAILGTSKE